MTEDRFWEKIGEMAEKQSCRLCPIYECFEEDCCFVDCGTLLRNKYEEIVDEARSMEQEGEGWNE